MSDPEVRELGDWALREGWNPGVGDLAVARACDPEAFVALREGNELVGGASIVSYGGKFGFVGLFILREDLRGRGLGGAFWDWFIARLKARLEPGAAIGLDGVYRMTPFYERCGFTAAYRHIRMQGIASGATDADAVRSLEKLLPDILALDAHYFPAPRDAFLRAWLGRAGTHVSGLYRESGLAGYGFARPCAEGFKIGPLFAADAETAGRILSDLMAQIAGAQVQIDMPEANKAATALAAQRGFKEIFGCVRLYDGARPTLDVGGIFAVTSLEFG